MIERNDRPVISVFGSHAPEPDSEDYAMATRVGRHLAQAGFVVATGGYSGTMAAVSQGAAEAGGHVIGVASGRIERMRGATLNQWVQTAIRYDNLTERLMHLVTKNDGMIVLPGGIGTLSEFALAWSFLQVGELGPRPLVLLGEMWRRTLDTFVQPRMVARDHVSLLKLAGTPEEAVQLLQQAFKAVDGR
ncbi:MAG: LOG family protein [Candidatus Promineifilaceae bacterium]|nr:LOG family protein [Candidatus Promineifilaceae bacterium]